MTILELQMKEFIVLYPRMQVDILLYLKKKRKNEKEDSGTYSENNSFSNKELEKRYISRG